MAEVERHVSFDVEVRQEFDGTYIAEIPSLQGCFAGGATLDEAVATLIEVLPVYLEAVEGVQLTEVISVVPLEGPEESGDDHLVARRELQLA